jgi:hypothetical protein
MNKESIAKPIPFWNKASLAVFGGIVLLWVLATDPLAGSGPSSSAPTSEPTPQTGSISTEAPMTRALACSIAQKHIRSLLISPSTAVFPSCFGPFGYGQHNFISAPFPSAANPLYIGGYVDSENVYGAMIRQRWYVQLDVLEDNVLSLDTKILSSGLL